ncbi:MAG: EAL domain-containing protein [Actinomycetota bacterium]|nr:EAL domain-containing protein [Actinomycetota bacterium]
MAAAGLLLFRILGRLPGAGPLPGPRLAWWLLSIAFIVGDMSGLPYQMRKHAGVVALSGVPLVVGLFLASPGDVVLARLVSGVVVFGAVQRRSPIKTCFNIAEQFCESAVALILFRLLAHGGATGPGSWAAALTAVTVAATFSTAMVVAVIAAYDGWDRSRIRSASLLAVVAIHAAVGVVGVLSVGVLTWDTRASALLVLLLGMLVIGFRQHAALTQRHLSLDRLYQFSRAVTSSPETEEVLVQLLHEAKDMLRADVAEVVFAAPATSDGPAGSMVARITSDRENTVHREAYAEADPHDPVLAGVFDRSTPVLVSATTRDPALRAWLAAHGYRDALATPFKGKAGVVGMLLVADRLGEVRTYGEDDLRLLETVANHASFALENGRLVDQLRHDAMHDSLTLLPNRVMLRRQLLSILHARAEGAGSTCAVLLMDLDGFKEVNDSLGHQEGDELLREVARRLAATARPGDTVARLGGDEFAILGVDISSPDQGADYARTFVDALRAPFVLAGSAVDIRVSIGVAFLPDHGEDAVLLLKRADVAMYAAKSSGRDVYIYESSLDGSTTQTLALVAELRHALDTETGLCVYVQPKSSADGQSIVGAEALIRWIHPEQGMITPDSFIPVAERSGLIEPLTTFVLETAVRYAASWRSMGENIGIAVNLSPRSLLNPTIVDEVSSLLRRYQLPPELLTLEITESTVMSDPERAIEMLHELREIGTKLSLDDFGTGYSSLSYLRRLPVTEVKIDKSFVGGMTTNAEQAVIVNSVIQLGHNLSLDVVAEGVEDEATWVRLHEMGCTVIQGYYLARPMPIQEFPSWLEASAPTTALRSPRALSA